MRTERPMDTNHETLVVTGAGPREGDLTVRRTGRDADANPTLHRPRPGGCDPRDGQAPLVLVPVGSCLALKRVLLSKLADVSEAGPQRHLEVGRPRRHGVVEDVQSLDQSASDATIDSQLENVLWQARPPDRTLVRPDAEDADPSLAVDRHGGRPGWHLAGDRDPMGRQEPEVIVEQAVLGFRPDGPVHPTDEVGVALLQEELSRIARVEFRAASDGSERLGAGRHQRNAGRISRS